MVALSLIQPHLALERRVPEWRRPVLSRSGPAGIPVNQPEDFSTKTMPPSTRELPDIMFSSPEVRQPTCYVTAARDDVAVNRFFDPSSNSAAVPSMHRAVTVVTARG